VEKIWSKRRLTMTYVQAVANNSKFVSSQFPGGMTLSAAIYLGVNGK
jgi:hypothetical protein